MEEDLKNYYPLSGHSTQQFKCSSTHHHSTAKLLRNKFVCQKCFRYFRGSASPRALVTQPAGSTAEGCRDLAWQICFYLVKSKEVYLVLLFCSQAGPAASKHLHAALEERSNVSKRMKNRTLYSIIILCQREQHAPRPCSKNMRHRSANYGPARILLCPWIEK